MSQILNRRLLLLLAGSAWARTGSSIGSKSTDYIGAWTRKDLDGIGQHLHPEVHFKGPMQELTGRDAVLAATQRIFPLLQRMDVRAEFTRGERTMFAYDFVCREPIGVCRTAELIRFEGGLIRDIELFFDARPFEALQRAQAGAPSAP